MTFDHLHTREHPYCVNLSCACHYDVAYHALVIAWVERYSKKEQNHEKTKILQRRKRVR